MSCNLWSGDVREQSARAVAALNLDIYEAAVRVLTELERLAARMASEPARSLTRAWADLTRDATAVQLSTARWVLDL